MISVRQLLLIGAVALVAATPLSAVGAETVTIKNNRSDKVKFCTYRSDDERLVRPRKCWMLKSGQSAKWPRGDDSYRFDVRVFGPGIFELPICVQRNVETTTLVEISPNRSSTCITARQRVSVPEQQWASDTAVLVNTGEDEYWYPAVILGPEPNGYRVLLMSGRPTIVAPKYIADDVIQPGLAIEVNWKNFGRWYPVEVLSRSKADVVVKFDDGAEETAILAYTRVKF
ncbi:tudor domain-containing protein [Parasphingorhabdus sp.]|uniref:tudor domain-containing protein n=1 Tax=Parasphingorhabdus sp. TaxID=2709688 RepID=UPI0032662ADA